MATHLCQKCKQVHPGRVCDYDEKGECAETIGVDEAERQAVDRRREIRRYSPIPLRSQRTRKCDGSHPEEVLDVSTHHRIRAASDCCRAYAR